MRTILPIMKIRETLNSAAKIAIVIAIGYAAVHWKGFERLGDDMQSFAESACIGAIFERYDVSRVNPYSFDKNSNGYVVRATATLNKGGNAKVSCLTGVHGGVRDIVITE